MKRMHILIMCSVMAAFAAQGGEMLLGHGKDFKVGNRQCKEFNFVSPDPAKGRVVIDFRSRIDYPRLGGWCPCWQIFVNGKVLTATATRSEPRLLNRPYLIPHKWFKQYRADNGSDKWYAIYMPEYGLENKGFVTPTSEASRTKLDISDIVRIGGTNVVSFRAGGLSTATYTANGITNMTPGVVFSDLKIYSEDERTKLPRAKEASLRASVKMPPVTKFALKESNAALEVEVRGRRTAVKSVFSVPGGGEAEMGGRRRIDTPFYSVERKMVKKANRIDVFDTFKSKTNALIGVKVRYEIGQKGFDPVYVAGDASPSADEFSGGRNPSVLGVCGEKGFSLALLAQDDVFRVQNVQYCKNGAFGIRTDGLALKPGEPRTVEWSIYPVESEDYYDFVNIVREDWDVNFPIVGSFNLSMNLFKRYSRESVQRLVENFGLTVNSFGCHIWSHLGGKYKNYRDTIYGMGLNSSKVRVRIDSKNIITDDPSAVRDFKRECIANARKHTPDLKILSYIHNQICVDADDDKYSEARMIGANGKPMNYNAGPSGRLFVPTKDNLYGKDFMKLVDWYLDSFDLDGLYHDELNHCNSRIYYGDKMWDEATVELDAENNVKRKLSYVCLLKLDFTLGMFDHIVNKRKKLFIGNFSPETRSERRFKFPRFEETYNSRWIALSHLYTPIQLGDMLTYANTPKDMAADQRIALMRGALYYHYCGGTGCPTLSSKMFPFTPVELHGGWLVGKERILTAVSGEFGWRGESPEVDVFVFDELGREVKGYPWSWKDTVNGRVFTLELKPDYCAAIVRK